MVFRRPLSDSRYRDGHTVVSDILGWTETFSFDANRELIYHIDAAGWREQSERDDFGRITVQTDTTTPTG